MNIQRLKHAWARGARLQVWMADGTHMNHQPHWSYIGGSAPSPRTMEQFPHRIHPDDDHLQYGPLSTALRDTALYATSLDDYPFMVDMFMDMAGRNWWIGNGTNIETDFARLFMAEMLADEGL